VALIDTQATQTFDADWPPNLKMNDVWALDVGAVKLYLWVCQLRVSRSRLAWW